MASETTTDTSTGDDDSLTVNLTLTAAPSKPRIPITVSSGTTPSQLRAHSATATNIPLASLRLIFRGRLIGDDDTKKVIEEFKLEKDCVIHCMGKPAAGAAPATTAPSSVPTTAGSSVSVMPPAAAAPAAPAATASVAAADPLQEALATLRSSNPPDVYLTAVTTVEKILNNITSHPMEEKYRRVKKQNAAFQRRLGGLEGGDAAMKAVGFTTETVEGEESYVMVPSAEAWPQLLANKVALAQAKPAASSASAPVAAPMPVPGAAAAPAFGAGAPGFGGTGAPGFGNVPPGMESAVANLMSNPSQLQAMLQNPMVRQMMERDPRFANNPNLRESMEQLAANPQMLSQAMQDPAMQRQMQSMMNSGNMPSGMGGGMGNSGMGGFGGGTAGGTPNTSSSPANAAGSGQGGNSNAQTGGRSDEEMTEEEMIAEAIARSMRET